MTKKKAARLLPTLTETEQDLLSTSNTDTSLKLIRSAATQFCGGCDAAVVKVKETLFLLRNPNTEHYGDVEGYLAHSLMS